MWYVAVQSVEGMLGHWWDCQWPLFFLFFFCYVRQLFVVLHRVWIPAVLLQTHLCGVHQGWFFSLGSGEVLSLLLQFRWQSTLQNQHLVQNWTIPGTLKGAFLVACLEKLFLKCLLSSRNQDVSWAHWFKRGWWFLPPPQNDLWNFHIDCFIPHLVGCDLMWNFWVVSWLFSMHLELTVVGKTNLSMLSC